MSYQEKSTSRLEQELAGIGQGIEAEVNNRQHGAVRLVRNGQPLTQFMTTAKLAVWVEGFKAGNQLGKEASAATQVHQARLAGFLLDDVRELVDAINESESMQGIKLSDAGFDTLGDFANYWDIHLKTFER